MKPKPPKTNASEADAFDWMRPFMSNGTRIRLNAGLVDIKEWQRLIAESENLGIAAHTFLNVTNVADLVSEGATRRAARKRGGKKTGDEKSALAKQSHEQWIAAAKSMNGTAPHELTGKVAKRFGKTSRAVRPVLQKAGLVPLRSKKEK